jgi:hypothetical protein
VEALVPDLVGSLGGDAITERELIERLITRGDADDWLRYLRERTQIVTASLRTHGPSKDATRFAAILRDQFLLAQGVCDLTPEDTAALKDLEQLGSSPESRQASPDEHLGRSR